MPLIAAYNANHGSLVAMSGSQNVNFEELRIRHAIDRPLQKLTDSELSALIAAELPQDDTPHWEHAHALMFLSRLEVQERT